MRTRLPFLSRRRGLTTLLGMPGLEACFDAQIPSSVNPDSVGRVAQWNDLTGKARHLLQGTLASQPLYLPWTGQNYGYCPGVAGNYFSTPDSAAVSVTGDMRITAKLSAVTWAGAAFQAIAAHSVDAGNQRSFIFLLNTFGQLALFGSTDGTGYPSNVTSTAAVSFSNNADGWVRVTRTQSSGLVRFFTSPDNVTWTQLGTDLTLLAGSALFNCSGPLEAGSTDSGGANRLNGKIYYAELCNDTTGTVVAAFDPSRANDGASSFVAATGETWTVNSSGGKPAQIVGRASVLFDGVDDVVAATFTLNQPETIYLVAKQLSWTSVDAIFDGATANTGKLAQFGTGGSPRINSYAGGADGINNAELPVGVCGVVATQFNGDYGSSLSVNRGARSNTNAAGAVVAVGTANMGGFTLGAAGNLSNNGNWQVSAVAIFAAAHDARTRGRVIDYLINRHRIAA